MRVRYPAQSELNVVDFLHKAGYSYVRDYNATQQSFAKRLGRDRYPRFHVYIDEVDGQYVLNLHLDQKAPSYAGSTAHSGEYDGPVVEAEADRLKSQMN